MEHDREGDTRSAISSSEDNRPLRKSSRKRKRTAFFGESPEDGTAVSSSCPPRPSTQASISSSSSHAEQDDGDNLHHLFEPGVTSSLPEEIDASLVPESKLPGGEEVEEKNKEEVETAEKQSCGICFEEVQEQGVLDSCRHDFCFTCIHRWSKVTNTCPMCKADFFSITRRLVGRTNAAEEQSSEADTPKSQPGKRGRGSAKRRKTSKKSQPQVVRVKPKKQQYRYSRREIEDIARAAEAETPYQPRFLGLFDFLATQLGGGPTDSHLHDDDDDSGSDDDILEGLMTSPSRYSTAGDEDEAGGDDENDGDRDFASLFGPSDDAPEPRSSRNPWSTRHWGEAQGTPTRARDRILSVLESRARQRADSHRAAAAARFTPPWGRSPSLPLYPAPLPPSFVPASHAFARGLPPSHDALHQQHLRTMSAGLEQLKSMFGNTFENDVLEAVLEQVGGSVERAVDALFAMQGPSDSPVASSEASPPHIDLTTSTTATTAAARSLWGPVHINLEEEEAAPSSSSSVAACQPRGSAAMNSTSAPIVLVPDEDVEIIAERTVTPRRASRVQAVGADRPRPQPLPSPVALASVDRDAEPNPPSASHHRLRQPSRFFARRFCPPRSAQPRLPPLVADDDDGRPAPVSDDRQGMAMAWRDFDLIQRERCLEERTRKLPQETSPHRPPRPTPQPSVSSRSASASPSLPSASSSSSSSAPAGRPRPPGIAKGRR